MNWRFKIVCAGLWVWLLVTHTGWAWFAVPPGPGVTTILDTQDNQFSWYAGPADQQEWLDNHGGSTATRIKGWQDVTGLKFNLSAYRGQRVVAAELHLARANANLVTSLAAATINTDWQEGTACWRYRALPNTEWAFSHSDFSVASFGNYGSLVCYGFGDGDGDTNDLDSFRAYTNGGFSWIAMTLDPAVVQALILDQYGLAVTDPRLHLPLGPNPAIYTHEQNASVQPRLFVQFASGTNTAPPQSVGNLAVVGGAENGSAVLQFTAPSDPDDGRAFGYNVRIATNGTFSGAADLERWRIPRPGVPGTAQRVLLENLASDTNYTFFVQAYDSCGHTGTPAGVSFMLPPTPPAAALADGGMTAPSATGKTVRAVAGILQYFGASEVARINPATGNRIEDGYAGTGADDYKKANVVWDAGSNVLMLAGCRNEMVGAQVVLQRLGAGLSAVSVTVSDLLESHGARIPANPNAELFQMHYVASGASKYAEAALPLRAPLPVTFSIPDANHNAGGVYQSVGLDLYLPDDAAAGTYTGTVTISAAELGTNAVSMRLEVRVSPIRIPDWPSFVIDLNGYGNPWDYGPDQSATCLAYFQAVHKHRAVPNTLPYGWSGNVNADRAPTLTGNGPTRHAASWTGFDAKYGRFFTGDPTRSAFSSTNGYTGPGRNMPITHFYTPFHEMWPQSMLDATHGFDAGGKGPAYWDALRAAGSNAVLFATCPDVTAAIPAGYRQAQRNVMTDWLQHARSNGWTRTAFEIYLNNKYSYSGTHSLWVLEECETADDFRAVGFLHQLWRDALTSSGISTVPWHFRIDISDRWGQHYGQLDNRINWVDMGSGAAGWHWPNHKYRPFSLDADKPEDWIWYGLGAPVAGSGVANAQTCLQKWCQGFDGGLPYWDCYNTQWTTADDSDPCVVYSGQNVPGFGLYAGPLISQRVKQLRQVQQIIELLNLWAASPGMNRTRVRDALNTKYGEETWDYAFGNLNELKLYQLRADLVAQLEQVRAAQTAGLRLQVR